MGESTNSWTVYMVRCGDGSLYTGIAVDIARRMTEHEGSVKGARYLRGRGPLQLIFQWTFDNRSLASRAEYRIKRLRKSEKEALVAAPERVGDLLV